jgi:hypothetical protein
MEGKLVMSAGSKKKYGVVDTDEFDQAVYNAFDTTNGNNKERPITEDDIKFVLSVISKEAPHDTQSIV